MIGLLGAHRTGKTSLAKQYAEKHGIAFIETSVSAIFKELGYDPAGTFDFATRLTIQEAILERLDKMYGGVVGQAICDRTPIDLMAYTAAEAVGESVTPADQTRFARYVQRCFEMTNKRFSTIILVQPGIPLVMAEGKAALNEAYIEHLNSLMLGLSVDQRVRVPHFYIPRQLIAMEDRLAALENAVGRASHSATQESAEMRAEGRLH